MSIIYEKGDCLQKSETKRIVVHIVNSKGGFGKGFALAIAQKYPIVRKEYKNWFENFRPNAGFSGGGNGIKCNEESIFKLGNNQYVNVKDNLTIVNMLCQRGYQSKINPIPVDYKALEICLLKISQYTEKSDVQIWMPDLIGCGLGGDNRDKVLEIIERILKDREVRIFQL